MTSAITALSKLPDDVRLHRLEALVSASESLQRASGLDDILKTILELIPVQLDCERATAFTSDLRTGKLYARKTTGALNLDIVLEKGVGIAGYVAETGESLLIQDVQSDPHFDRATDRRTGYLTKNMLCVPMHKSDGASLGSLQAINAGRGQFTEVDLAYLESFASLASVAVEREQLAQEAFRSQLLSTELDLARKIQQRLLPPPGEIDLPAPFSAWGRSQPCYDVGGDTYDAVMLPTGECAFWVADVSGKGIGAALLMTTLQTELRALVRAESDLARLASELNARVNVVAPLGTYATMFLGVLSADEERMRYINAGHMPPVWMNRRISDAREFEPSGMPVGMLPGSAYSVGEWPFKLEERLAVFSDGVTDAENTAGETYEDDGLYKNLESINAQGTVRQIGEAFFEELDRFRIGAPAKDDTTYLVVGLS
ncbi:MAG: PP2C family protein-serine/threonine phosphatase [Pyrinomonadaceae bacterium]